MIKPKNVVIGPITYDVIYDQASMDSESVDNNVELVGLTEPYKATIHVSPGISEQVQPITLAHEVLHALWFSAGLNHIDNPTQENVVSMMAPGLVSFLRDNIVAVEYLSS